MPKQIFLGVEAVYYGTVQVENALLFLGYRSLIKNTCFASSSSS